MRDTELYARIPGVQAPWNVDCVDFRKENKEVCITVSLSKTGYRCPVCGKPCNGYDVKRRRWRHLDTCQYSTFIEADVPRVECSMGYEGNSVATLGLLIRDMGLEGVAQSLWVDVEKQAVTNG